MEENNGPDAKPKLRLAKHPGKKTEPAASQPETPVPDANPATPAPPSPPESSGAADPGDPFGAIRKPKAEPAGESAAGSAVTPPPPPPPPHTDPSPEPVPAVDSTPPPVEAAPEPTPPPATPSARHGLLLSMVVVSGLFLLLFASAAGIWWVLREPPEKESTVAADRQTPPPAAPVKAPVPGAEEPRESGPVSRAKQAIAALEAVATPEEVLDAVDTDAPAEETGSVPAQLQETVLADAEGAPAPDVPVTGAAAAAPATASDEAARTAHQEAVTEFLASVFVGAVGGVSSNPRAMIDGENYSRGDLINAELGLRFVEADRGTLYFRDEYGIIYVKRF